MQNNENLMPSNKKFGLFFSFVFLCVTIYYRFLGAHGVNQLWLLFLILSAVFLLSALCLPIILKPFNILWFKLGLLLGKIVSPIILGIMFFGLITPIALFLRIKGRDELKLKFHRYQQKQSYWLNRDAGGPPPDSFNNQF
ncbi:MAG: hypothetical protein K0U45_00585 [Alphaproteobacteria bacterium]|nr:hypothetical protein [Alphaproteobacteria bacterium]